MRPEDLICPTPQGLYCPPADVYIDPMRPVPRALITHGHSDHARAGHGAVMATEETLGIMAERYGEDFTGSRQPIAFGQQVTINGVDVAPAFAKSARRLRCAGCGMRQCATGHP